MSREQHAARVAWRLGGPAKPVVDAAPEVYVPADIIGDRVLATHCETYLCTECEMSREDRMKRITQSIADYRECHATRARKGQRPE